MAVGLKRLGGPQGLTGTRLRIALRSRLERKCLQALQQTGLQGSSWCSACGTRVVAFFRYDANAAWGCPRCRASPRERLVNAALDAGLLRLPAQGRTLQIAPGERSLVRRFSAAGELVAGDLDPTRYAVPGVRTLDLMEFSELGDFDLIYAAHVLEHVPDDHCALRNMRAQLRPGGEVWLMVPQHGGPTTHEAWPGITRAEREMHFWQWDHARLYGADFADRMVQAGFDVQVLGPSSFDSQAARSYGLNPRDAIYVGRGR